MILTSIKMQCFRQYLHPIEIDFSINKEKNITLIMASNGVGKTTMLQAFRYCFYGQRSAYFNLPKNDELVNNELHKKLKEGHAASMFVEVTFKHKNLNYIARREIKYVKKYNKVSTYGNEKFTLNYLTTHDGWKAYDEDDSYNKMHQILPDGLSQVFMFDGERMERNISEIKFRNELKDSILGILGIKKYDKLIDIIGSEGKRNSVLGLLHSRITSNSKEDQKLIDNYQTALEKADNQKEKIEANEAKIDDIEERLDKLSVEQTEIDENKLKIAQRDTKEEIYTSAQNEHKNLANRYLGIANKLLIYKMMLEEKNKYDLFINQNTQSDLFYDHLHMHTLEAILDKGVCLCGHQISHHSKEEKRIEELKEYALPREAAQNLNLIAQKYKMIVEYKELFDEAKKIKELIINKKIEIKKIRDTIGGLSRSIQEVEKKFNKNTEIQYQKLMQEKEEITRKIGGLEQDFKHFMKVIDKAKNAMSKIENQNISNIRINQLKNLFKQIKLKLESYRDNKDRFARSVLTEEFESSISDSLEGKYEAKINEKYRINIIDKISDNDVTKVLSTGQNVVVQLAFMQSLINTAKRLSDDMDIDENYGVIMDAALSNLDEKHIKNVCHKNLIKLDQLIFLSFKKQLRNEMYNGIKENIGKAYLIERNEKGTIENKLLDIDELYGVIHTEDGEDDE